MQRQQINETPAQKRVKRIKKGKKTETEKVKSENSLQLLLICFKMSSKESL